MKKWTMILGMIFAVLAYTWPAAAMAEDTATTKAQIVSGVSFRDKPNTSSNVMRTLKKDETVTLTKYVSASWYQIQDANGVSGYVSTSDKYIKVLSNAKIVYGVNFRTTPSSDASSTVIRMLSKGEEVLVLQKMNDSWYKIQDGSGVVGYISTSSKYMVADFSVIKPDLPISDAIEAVISAGYTYLGTPYEYGSVRNDPTTFDCSDFTQTAFWDALYLSIPSDSQAQGDYIKKMGPVVTSWKNLKRGDLMFFSSYKGSKASDYANMNINKEPITHVGIYLGDGTILHTYSVESGGVRVDKIAGSQWENRFLYGGAVLR